jgi:hypothetical protein
MRVRLLFAPTRSTSRRERRCGVRKDGVVEAEVVLAEAERVEVGAERELVGAGRELVGAEGRVYLSMPSVYASSLSE